MMNTRRVVYVSMPIDPFLQLICLDAEQGQLGLSPRAELRRPAGRLGAPTEPDCPVIPDIPGSALSAPVEAHGVEERVVGREALRVDLDGAVERSDRMIISV